LVGFALAWYLTQETGSATVLATAVLISFLPQIVLGPFVGPYIDRWNRKKILIISDLFIALVTAGLVILFLTETIQVWHIYVAMVSRAVGGTFHFPALSASIPLIVPDKYLARAAGLNQMLGGVVNIVAPPFGALLLEILPMYGVLAVDIGTAIIAVGCISVITIPNPVRTTLTAKTSAISDMVQGFRYIWSWRGLAILMGLSALLNFFVTPAFVLMPVFVTEHLESDVLKLGWLDSAFGVGTIAGGLVLGVWGGFKRRMYTSIMGILIAGASMVGLGFTTVGFFLLGVTCSFLIGVGLAMGNGPIMALLQSVIAKDMQGRIFSIIGSISAAMSPLGLAVAGPLADVIGVRFLFYIAGAATIIIMIACVFIPDIMNLEKQKVNNSSLSSM
jgi:DHA3 family macrolide efflux protein-like MFS transporter